MPKSVECSQYKEGSRHTNSIQCILVTLKLEIPLGLHGIISHLHTWLPTNDESERYHASECQSVELMDNILWEPHHSTKFVEHEAIACMTHMMSVARVASPPHPNLQGNAAELE